MHHDDFHRTRVSSLDLLLGLKLDHIPQAKLLEGYLAHLAVMEKELAVLRLNESKSFTTDQPMNRALHLVALTGLRTRAHASTTVLERPLCFPWVSLHGSLFMLHS